MVMMEQLKCPSKDECVKKTSFMCVCVCVCVCVYKHLKIESRMVVTRK